MRICLVSQEYPPETGWGGIGTYTYELAHGLASAGHDVHVLSLSLDRADHTSSDGKVTVHRLATLRLRIGLWRMGLGMAGATMLRSLTVARALRGLHRVHRIDLVEAPEYSAEGFILSWLRPSGVPLHVRLHTPYLIAAAENLKPIDLNAKLIDWMEKIAVRRADIISSPTRSLAELSALRVGLDDRIRVLPHPIDVERFSPRQVSADPDVKTVLYVGRLERLKGVGVLAASIPSILEKHPAAHFRFIGADTLTGPQQSSMKAFLLNTLPPSARSQVEVLNPVDRTRLPSYLSQADLCVFPSYHENFPYALLEAMACGRAVVGSRTGGMVEIIEDGVSGLLAEPGDSKSLTEAILKALGDPLLRITLGEQARTRALTSYATTIIVPQMVALYRHALRGVDRKRG
ncbi:MAG TPA: glycosyltransferase family 4 protein [Candidatus Methylomirabilis sp.]|nr:glycosyltransferase family 4 protein [Candidatus Methylomirabilis sp.]